MGVNYTSQAPPSQELHKIPRCADSSRERKNGSEAEKHSSLIRQRAQLPGVYQQEVFKGITKDEANELNIMLVLNV